MLLKAQTLQQMTNYPNFPGWRAERTNSRSAETFGP